MKDFKAATLGTLYTASITGLVPVASATDIFQIYGSASKLVKVWEVALTGFAGTGVTVPMSLILRKTLNSAGTAATPSIGQFDINSPAPTATNIQGYTANPTLGTNAYVVLAQYITLGATTLANPLPPTEFSFGDFNAPVVLRAPSQGLCINFNGTSVTSGVVGITIVWSEE